jgi:hypothetical protein
MKPTVSSPLVSGSELRRILVLRDRLRASIVGLPRAEQREVLRALETARQMRQEGHTRSWTPPEMTRNEIIREIKWRLDAASLVEVEAAVRVLDRAERRAGTRTTS